MIQPAAVSEPPPLASPRRRAILIVRSDRARQRKDREDRLSGGKEWVGGVVQALAARGIDAQVRLALRRKDATRLARAAAAAGAELVVAGGGDRTVASVARGLVHSKSILGIVPLGAKRNALAARLGVPTALDAACDLLAGGQARVIDAIDIARVSSPGRAGPDPSLDLGVVGGHGTAGMPSDQEPSDGWWGGPPMIQRAAHRPASKPASWRPDKVSAGTPAASDAVPAALRVIVGPASAASGPASHAA